MTGATTRVFRIEGLESDCVIPADKLDEIDARIAERYKSTVSRHLAEKERIDRKDSGPSATP